MVTFRLLGEVGVCEVPGVGHARVRCVLAALLVDVNRVVATDALVDRVWGDQLPRQPREALYSYLSRLRRVLDGVPEVTLTKRSGGYVLVTDAASVDLHRFRALVAEAGAVTDDQAKAALLDAALELWTGRPLTGVDSSWAEEVRESLAAEHLAARLARFDLKLRMGRHDEVVAPLTELAGQRPLDEQVWRRLLLALARNGRQAEALACYDTVRRRLDDELGVDPGPELREVYHGLLDATTAEEPRQSVVVPRQLPAAPATFAGRARELAALDAATRGDVVSISAIGGAGGVGKTWLALHWAHRNADRFPDGQLYVNLRGHAPTSDPLPPETALRGLLGGLGVDQAAIPADLDAQAALYRGILAVRRVLVFLDDARDADQVLPLLPGGGASTVLITSRSSLPDLVVTGNARQLTVSAMPDAESRDLLARRLGADRMSAEPAAVEEVLRWCAGLPLALAIAAARVVESGPVAVAAELRETGDRLSALDTGGLRSSLRTVFEASHAVLSPAAATLFGQLGVAPGPDIGLRAVTAIGGTRAVLRELVLASLVHEHRPGRYRLHDLVRLYATEKCTDAAREQALTRVIDHYLHSAIACATVMCPHRAPGEVSSASDPYLPTDLADAMRWTETEHPALMAACDLRRPDVTAPLARALSVYHWRRGRLRDCITMWTAARDVASRTGERDVLARAHTNIGDSHATLGDFAAALVHLELGLTIATDLGDLAAQANAHNSLAWACDGASDHERALHHARLALDLYEALGEPQLLADMLNCVGWSLIRLGQHDEGRAECEKALALCDELGHADGTAHVSRSLGTLALETGAFEEAVVRFRTARDLFGELDHPFAEAGVLARLGEAELALGHHDLARRAWERALALYERQHRISAVRRVQARLREVSG